MTESTKTTENELLEDVLNALDITFDDDAMKKKLRDIMRQGQERLVQLKGSTIDFTTEQTARMLLFSFCRYGRSNAIEQFERDFACQLTAFALEAAIAGMPERTPDENKI